MTGYEPVAATPPAWRFGELGQRAEFLDRQIERLDELAVTLATARAPSLPYTASAPTPPRRRLARFCSWPSARHAERGRCAISVRAEAHRRIRA
jgi:hypothetical protein